MKNDHPSTPTMKESGNATWLEPEPLPYLVTAYGDVVQQRGSASFYNCLTAFFAISIAKFQPDGPNGVQDLFVRLVQGFRDQLFQDLAAARRLPPPEGVSGTQDDGEWWLAARFLRLIGASEEQTRSALNAETETCHRRAYLVKLAYETPLPEIDLRRLMEAAGDESE